MFVVGLVSGPLAHDFQNELYPQAKELLAGGTHDPEAIWPPARRHSSPCRSRSSRRRPPTSRSGSSGSPAWPRRSGSSACATGASTAWSASGRQVLGDIRIAHLTPLLCLLAAVVWRYRDRPLPAGLGARRRRRREVLPLAPRRLAARERARPGGGRRGRGRDRLGAARRARSRRSTTTCGRSARSAGSSTRTATRLRAPDAARRRATRRRACVHVRARRWCCSCSRGGARASRSRSPRRSCSRRSSGSTSTRSPRSRSRSRGRACRSIWFLPLVTWGLPSSGIAADPSGASRRVLVVYAIVLLVAARERAGLRAATAAQGDVLPGTSARRRAGAGRPPVTARASR